MTTSNIFYIQCLIILFPVDLLQYLEDFNEKIDNVQVELNGSQDIFLSAESGHDHLWEDSLTNVVVLMLNPLPGCRI